MPGNKKRSHKKRRRADVPVHRNRKVLKSTKHTFNAWLLSPDRMKTKVDLARIRHEHCSSCCQPRSTIRRRGASGGGRWPWAIGGTAGLALVGTQWEIAARLLAAATGS